MRYLSLFGSAFCVFFGLLASDGSNLRAFNFALAVLNFGFFLFPTKSFRDTQ